MEYQISYRQMGPPTSVFLKMDPRSSVLREPALV